MKMSILLVFVLVPATIAGGELFVVRRKGKWAGPCERGRRGHVTRARITQIMALLNLASDIQEGILFLPRAVRGCEPITERDVRPVAALLDWLAQRATWRKLLPP